jgi:hypothetical protein
VVALTDSDPTYVVPTYVVSIEADPGSMYRFSSDRWHDVNCFAIDFGWICCRASGYLVAIAPGRKTQLGGGQIENPPRRENQ